jgi:hypothetical protein
VKIHPDFNDFVTALNKNGVQFLIVGSFALAFHGCPRATGDIDFWIRPTIANAKNLLKALKDFGFGKLDISERDVLSGNIIQLGYPPVRIDLVSVLAGLTPEEIWEGRQAGKFGKHDVHYISKDSYIKNKRAVGRHKDLADLELLGEEL